MPVPEQIPHSELARPACVDLKRIRIGQTGPSSWDGPQMGGFVFVVNVVFSPVLPLHNQFEFPPAQRMKWMSYPERLSIIVGSNCSW